MPRTTETEADTRANSIDPALRDAGWGVLEGSWVNREMIYSGRITGGGGRAESAVGRLRVEASSAWGDSMKKNGCV